MKSNIGRIFPSPAANSRTGSHCNLQRLSADRGKFSVWADLFGTAVYRPRISDRPQTIRQANFQATRPKEECTALTLTQDFVERYSAPSSPGKTSGPIQIFGLYLSILLTALWRQHKPDSSGSFSALGKPCCMFRCCFYATLQREIRAETSSPIKTKFATR